MYSNYWLRIRKANQSKRMKEGETDKQQSMQRVPGSKQGPLWLCVSQVPVHAEPSELPLITVNLHPGSLAAMTHESHMLHPIYHFNCFHFPITIYFLCCKLIYTSDKFLVLGFLISYGATLGSQGVVSAYNLTKANLLLNPSISHYRLN